LTKAFITESDYPIETAEVLIEYLKGCKNIRRLYGWELLGQVSSPPTFSRAFSDFATGKLP
jgi:hypothetical protein